MQVLMNPAIAMDFGLDNVLYKPSRPVGIAQKSLRRKRTIGSTEPASAEVTAADARMQHLFASQLEAWQQTITESQDQQVMGNSKLFPGLSVRFAGVCLKGSNPATPAKPNQDRILILEDSATASLVLACLDGHGLHGHSVAQYFKTALSNSLCRHPLFASDPQRAIAQVLVQIEFDLYSQVTGAAGAPQGLADYS
eukprot:gene41459-50587_t